MQSQSINLATFSSVGDSKGTYSDGIVFETPPKQWEYAVAVPCGPIDRGPVVLEIDVNIDAGVVGLGCVDSSATTYVTEESTVTAGSGRRTLKLLVERPGADYSLIARNVSGTGERTRGTIFGARIRDVAEYPASDIKRLRSRRYPYWHYSYDLGDGVSVEASLPGVMTLHEISHGIIMGLYDRHFGGVSGKSVIDVACSSGYHSLGLRSRGAVVTGIDYDAPCIEQARFVQECTSDGLAPDVTFMYADLFDYSTTRQFDLFLCSGLLYHLRDLVGGAQKLFDLATAGGVIASCVAAGNDDIMELANPTKYICCFEGEFSFVPTAGMLEKILKYAGFREILRYSPLDLCPPETFELLLPQYADLFRANFTYFVVKR